MGTLEIHDMPGHLIRRLNQISVSVFTERTLAAGHNVTPVQYAALAAIHARPGIDQATLAGLIAYDRVTIGGVVDRLEQKDYIRRIVSGRDRRSRELHLTADGKALLGTLRPIVGDLQTDIIAGLSAEERRAFIALLKKTTQAGNDMSRAPLKAE